MHCSQNADAHHTEIDDSHANVDDYSKIIFLPIAGERQIRYAKFIGCDQPEAMEETMSNIAVHAVRQDPERIMVHHAPVRTHEDAYRRSSSADGRFWADGLA